MLIETRAPGTLEGMQKQTDSNPPTRFHRRVLLLDLEHSRTGIALDAVSRQQADATMRLPTCMMKNKAA